MNMTDAQGNTIVKKRPVFIVQMDGKDAPDVEIRTPIISQKVSKIAKVPEFRKIIVQCQRLFASQLPTNLQHNGRTLSQDDPYFGGVVMDGRDIGSVVLSHAQIKIFMVADPKVRAQRRLEEILKAAKNKQDADSIDREAVLQDLIHRDHEDENRQASPLIQSQGSIVLDSSTMELDDRVNFITDLVLKEWPGVASQLASN